MAELRKEAFGPHGDSTRHRGAAELEAGLVAMPASAKDSGLLMLIVRRLADGTRETPEAVHLSPETGVPGDGWDRRPPRNPDAQLAVMSYQVAELIANGQELSVFGDNLFVDLDVSAENLPVGTRLRIGEALVEVTPKPHNGCSKFRERFGQAALDLVWAPETRHRNLRGIYWKVLEAGDVAVGSRIEVLSRP
jgi:MOSC domain-containing protein YiiM